MVRTVILLLVFIMFSCTYIYVTHSGECNKEIQKSEYIPSWYDYNFNWPPPVFIDTFRTPILNFDSIISYDDVSDTLYFKIDN